MELISFMANIFYIYFYFDFSHMMLRRIKLNLLTSLLFVPIPSIVLLYTIRFIYLYIFGQDR